MLQVARLAPKLLADATKSVESYLTEQIGADGAAQDRAGDGDLYYTVFALDGLLALQAPLPTEKVANYLRSFRDGVDLDLPHLACLARSWAALPDVEPESSVCDGMMTNLQRFRSRDGGFHAEPGSERGTVYHAFLALGAHHDLHRDCGDTERLVESVNALRSHDGGFANTPGLPVGSTTVTAAAVTLLRYLQSDLDTQVGEWLLDRAHPQGGFQAAPQVPAPDLLSTATALHALAAMHVDAAEARESTLDFVDSLWTGKGFCGHWADDVVDCEYTFYALLALGHLSL